MPKKLPEKFSPKGGFAWSRDGILREAPKLRFPYQLPLPLHPFLVEPQLEVKDTTNINTIKINFMFII